MITALVGPNGAGKTVLAVEVARRLSERLHRPLVSNIEIPGGIVVDSWTAMAEHRGAVVVIDEIIAAAGSRESRSLSRAAQLWLTTLRHHDTALFWTSPAYDRADLVLRQVTQRVIEVVPLWHSHRSGRIWSDTTLAVAVTRRATADGSAKGWPLGVKPFRPARVGARNDVASWGDVRGLAG